MPYSETAVGKPATCSAVAPLHGASRQHFLEHCLQPRKVVVIDVATMQALCDRGVQQAAQEFLSLLYCWQFILTVCSKLPSPADVSDPLRCPSWPGLLCLDRVCTVRLKVCYLKSHQSPSNQAAIRHKAAHRALSAQVQLCFSRNGCAT